MKELLHLASDVRSFINEECALNGLIFFEQKEIGLFSFQRDDFLERLKNAIDTHIAPSSLFLLGEDFEKRIKDRSLKLAILYKSDFLKLYGNIDSLKSHEVISLDSALHFLLLEDRDSYEREAHLKKELWNALKSPSLKNMLKLSSISASQNH